MNEKEVKNEIRFRKEIIDQAEKDIAKFQKTLDSNRERVAELEERLKTKGEG